MVGHKTLDLVDHGGLIRLSNILTSVEERLLALVTGCPYTISPLPQIHIPNHNSWIVTMWHFGTDSLSEYAGEKFEHDVALLFLSPLLAITT